MTKYIIGAFGLTCAFAGIAGEQIQPLLPGFHPDPSICRVGSEYYLANSSFTWYPGIPIYRSKDLQHWKLVGHAASGEDWKSLAKIGSPISGLWAPTIRHINGNFHVICTCYDFDMSKRQRVYRGHFLVSAENPAGPWSAPKWIKGVGGIDPSLFQDVDGKVYLLTNSGIAKRHVQDQNQIAIWEFDLDKGCVIGEKTRLVCGLHTRSRWTEGPHLYRMKNGQYLLVVAEGGTGAGHAVTAFLSDEVRGPYTPCEHNPVITRRDSPKSPIQCTGHADLVETPTGEMYAVFLAVRNAYGKGTSPFGRETFMCPARFDEQAQSLFFDETKFISGSVDEPRDLVYTCSNQGARLRRLMSPNECEERMVHWDGTLRESGLVVERSELAMLRLVRRKDEVAIVKTHKNNETTLAQTPCSGAETYLKLTVNAGLIRCYVGESAKECRQLGGEWHYGFLDGEYAIGAGIGQIDLKDFCQTCR